MISLKQLLTEGEIKYPPNHKPGVRVPKGGAMCANCEYHNSKENICNNKYWRQWTETNKIPYPGNEYCCNWWEQK